MAKNVTTGLHITMKVMHSIRHGVLPTLELAGRNLHGALNVNVLLSRRWLACPQVDAAQLVGLLGALQLAVPESGAKGSWCSTASQM